jgi:hypothetical protein
MRLFTLPAILALAVLIGLSDEKAPGAGKSTSKSSGSGGGSSSKPSSTPTSKPSGGGGTPTTKPGGTPSNPGGGSGGIPGGYPGARPGYPGGYPGGYRGVPPGYRPGAGARLVPLNLDVSFTFNSDVGKVRTVDPPAGFDEKGNIKKHTKEELEKLKGDTPEEKKLAGYKSDFSELKVGDMVQVALSVYKTNAPRKAAPGAKKDDKDAVKDEKPAELDKVGKDGRWVVATQVIGKVTSIDPANTISGPKMTIRVTTVQVAQGNSNPPANKPLDIKPEQGQATLILAGRRPPEPVK